MSVLNAARNTSKVVRTGRTSDLMARAHAARDVEHRRQLLDDVIVLNMCVADSIVARYQGRGVSSDDLRQVAYAALTRAAHRFDPAQGVDFLSFAVPSMRGEVRKYFRDHAWMVRPTRRIQELQPVINRTTSELSRELGRSPRPNEIAERLSEPVEVVIEALSTDGCFAPASLDKPVRVEDSGAPLGELLGSRDPAQDVAEARVILQPVVRRLSERDQHILELRFVRGLTQREIADDIGVTQMQVSRLLARIIRDLRLQIGDPDDPRHTTRPQGRPTRRTEPRRAVAGGSAETLSGSP